MTDVPGFDAGTPLERVWREPTASELQARWDAEGVPVWADGEELTLVAPLRRTWTHGRARVPGADVTRL